MVKRLTKEYKIDINPADYGVSYVGYQGPHKTLQEKIESFLKMINSLEGGNTYLFVDHPGIDSPELRSIHHVGYEDVAID